MISLLCTVVTLYSGYIYRVIGEGKLGISKWSYRTFSALSFLSFLYLSVMSFIFFVTWDVRDDKILYQSVIFVILTILLNLLFFKKPKSKLLLVISILWCLGIVFYAVYVFNVKFLLEGIFEFKFGSINIELALLCMMVVLASAYLIKLNTDVSRWMVKVLFVINLGTLVCGLTLSFAVLFVKENRIWLPLFSLLITILFLLLVYRIKNKKIFIMVTTWNLIMSVYFLSLIFVSFDN